MGTAHRNRSFQGAVAGVECVKTSASGGQLHDRCAIVPHAQRARHGESDAPCCFLPGPDISGVRTRALERVRMSTCVLQVAGKRARHRILQLVTVSATLGGLAAIVLNKVPCDRWPRLRAFTYVMLGVCADPMRTCVAVRLRARAAAASRGAERRWASAGRRNVRSVHRSSGRVGERKRWSCLGP